MPVLHATHESKKEQAQLLDQLTRLSRTHPDMTATALVQWYLERVKESRSRLASGSADSPAAVAMLMRYATRRRDIDTLRRLRAPARHWTRQCGNSRHLQKPSLSTKLHSTLFGLAAQHDHWPVMYRLVQDKSPRDRWTPFMCLALLRAKSTTDMIQARDPTGPDAEAKRALWGLFLHEFGHYLAMVRHNSTTTAPPWILMALMELYARCGNDAHVWRLLHMYVASIRRPEMRQEGPLVLRNAPCRLLPQPTSYIPGPRLLHAVMRAYARRGDTAATLSAFARLTSTSVPDTFTTCEIPWHATDVVLEPSNTSIILAMDAMLQQRGVVASTVPQLLHFLKQVDRSWGSWRARHEPAARPMFINLRTMRHVLTWCLHANAHDEVRHVLRFQQGLLRRELRWHTSPHARPVWLQDPNEWASLRRWRHTLQQLVQRRWISERQERALYVKALHVVRHRVMGTARKMAHTSHRHIIPSSGTS